MNDESLFHEALELPASERAAFLTATTGDDAALRRRVERLLQAHAAPSGFMVAPPVAVTDAYQQLAERNGSAPTEALGTQIGSYRLLEQIGEGGFGVVYMAEQLHPVRRKVALKILKPGMDTRQVVGRFEAERQALAIMDHPNIAQVFDGGKTASGRPYFVMELVRGVPITEFCDSNHLDIRERLVLFCSVCHAVQHAHQRGLIHRDLKPSNLLVTLHDGKAVVKVIDFGIAKAIGQQLTDKTLFTNFAQLIGTPMYMSPEQAQFSGLDIDTRTDIYSLGVLLYELLTGTTPFDKERLREAGYDEIRRIIREDEPARPSTRMSTLGQAAGTVTTNRQCDIKQLSQLLRGELDWIVMKALEKDRTRRYESASAFADDVQRYLNDEPVLACPPTKLYRFCKFARRNQVALTAGSAVAAALVLGTAVAIWQAVVANRALAEEKKAKEQAEIRSAETQSVLNFVETKILAAARPEGQGGGLGRDVPLRKAIAAAADFVDSSFAKEPLIEARLRMTLGQSFFYLGEMKQANLHLQKALSLYTEHRGADHADTHQCINGLANSFNVLGRYDDARKLYEESLEFRKSRLGPDHPDTLITMNNLANSYHGLARHHDALYLRAQTLALRKVVLGADHPDTLMSMNNLSTSYHALGRNHDALKLREETLALRQKRLGIDHPDTLGSMNNLSNTFFALGRNQDALELRERTLALRQAKVGPDHPDTLMSMSNLAISYRSVNRFNDALRLHEETLAIRRRKLGPEHPETLGSLTSVANAYADLGRHADAAKLRAEALALHRLKIGLDHPATLMCMYNLAQSYMDLGQDIEALELHQETLAKRQSTIGANHPESLMSMRAVAKALINLDRSDEALPIIDDCVRRASLPDVEPKIGIGAIELRMQVFQKRQDAAGCQSTAELWEQTNRVDPASLYVAARLRAITAGVIRSNDASETVGNLADAEDARAVAWLQKTIAAGFRDADTLSKDAHFLSLRNRPDFKSLLAEMPVRQ